MDIAEILKAALYGVVEGITEWLPISSTGHMLLLDNFVPLHVSVRFWNMFLVVIQLGAIAAVCRLYFHELNPLARGKSSAERRATWGLWGKIVVACVPAAAVGIPLDDWIEAHLGGPLVIAAALIVYGVAFIVIETLRERRARRVVDRRGRRADGAPAHARHLSRPAGTSVELADADARVRDIDDLDLKTALGIGIFQVLSLVPGTSRSGSTIIGALVLGCSRAVAAKFTFYLAVPVMVGASALRLAKFLLQGGGLSLEEAAIVVVGCATAYAVSLAAIRFIVGFVQRHDFKPFGWYRIALGVGVIACVVFLWS